MALQLPAPLKELWSFWRDIEAKTMRPIDLALVAKPGMEREHWRDALLLDSRHPNRLFVLGPGDRGPASVDLALILLDGREDPTTWADLAPLGIDPDRRLVVLIGTLQAHVEARRRQALRALDVPETRLVIVENLAEVAGEVARRIFSLDHDLAIPIARQFPIFRNAAAWEEIHVTAKQNAVVGLIPVLGGDLPIMTANQIKMVLRMAAIFDLPIDSRRAQEIMAVVGGGFGLRAVARQVVKLVPGPGWIVGGGIGYTGTIAMGRGALSYFKRQSPAGELPAPRTPEPLSLPERTAGPDERQGA